MIDYLQKYSGAIQAIVAILNLVIIAILSFRGFQLQKKSSSLEAYSALQYEIMMCFNELEKSIQYFEKSDRENSQYLYNLSNETNIDHENDEHINLSNNIAEDLSEILKNLHCIRDKVQQLSLKSNKNSIKIEDLTEKLTKICAFKIALINQNPSREYQEHTKGALATWIDAPEVRYSDAYQNTMNNIRNLKKILQDMK